MRELLTVDRERLARLCRRHGIRRLSLFGSALRGEFLPGTPVGLRFITIQDEPSALLGRPVDLNTPGFLSRHFRERVLHDARALQEAA